MKRDPAPVNLFNKLYLVLFNLGSCIGWSCVLYLWLLSVLAQDKPYEFWGKVGFTLNIVQSLAVMEIVHAVFGIVKSPLATVIPQVFSRVFLLWGHTDTSIELQSHWSIYLFIGSWACAEIPRYSFYVLRQFIDLKKLPYPVKFLRYSLFMVLYPTGISGELIQMFVHLPLVADRKVLFYWYLFVIVGYAPVGPFLYTYMLKSRRRVLNPRRKPRPPCGVEFPEDKTGRRSTMSVNFATFAESIKGVDEKAYNKIKKLGSRRWRRKYINYVGENMKVSCMSKDKAMTVAKQGLKFLHETMVFIRDGKEIGVKEAMEEYGKGNTFFTGYIEGKYKGKEGYPRKKISVPYKGKNLEGEELKAKLKYWAKYGTIEQSCADAIIRCVDNEEWCDLSDKYFVLLGATSAMGPLFVLLALGANIIAIDYHFFKIWDKLFNAVENSPGTLTFPTKKPFAELKDNRKLLEKESGCDLLTQTPEIASWLIDLYPGRPLIIGGYCYLDGARFVKISVAMDLVMEKVLSKRPNSGIGFLCSPTDVFLISEDAYDTQKRNFRKSPFWQKLILNLNFKRSNVWLRKNPRKVYDFKNDDGERVCLNNGLVWNQGPNYALAKRLQHWRCIIAQSQGHICSSNIAPSTRTASVVSNYKFEMAYSGLHLFKPMEVMYQEVSNAVMGALLIHDFSNEDCMSNPKVPRSSPMALFEESSFHGGIWRAGYQIESMAMPSAIHFMFKNWWHWVGLFVGGTVTTIAVLVKKPPHTWF